MNLKKPDTWPDFMLCMPAKQKPLILDQYIWERKLDGIRVQVSSKAIRTRSLSLFDHEIKLRSGQAIPDHLLLDGELMSPDGFTAVQGQLTRRQWKKLVFVPFDLLQFGGKPIWEQNTRSRLALLNEYDPGPERLGPGQQIPMEWEGVVCKPNCSYFPGRRVQWIKWKNTGVIEAYVLRFEEGTGTWAGMPGKVIFGVNVKGTVYELGAASGLTTVQRWQFHHQPELYLGKKCRIQHYGMVKTRFRNPIFLGMADDADTQPAG